MTKSTALVAALITFLTGSVPRNSFAQGVQTGTIRGVVVDEQGLPVREVSVTVSSPVLQGMRTMVTGADGSYVFAGLPPGAYEMTFQLASFASITQATDVALGLTVEQDVMLRAAGVTEEVDVVAEVPPPLATPILGANYKNAEINLLATPRALFGIAQLAPGLTDNTPNNTQITINGSFAFDNIFMVNGVDVSDNLLGQPHSLFIEEAIEETQVLTSGLTAEYGRFTGGVVNAVTRSGGNILSGSFRTNFENPAWTVETPWERCDTAVTAASCRPAPERQSDLQSSFEGTLGGPLVRDRLWFFAAGRYFNVETQGTLPFTNTPNIQTDLNNRAEIKITGTANSVHTFQGGYLTNYRDQEGRTALSYTMDRFAIDHVTTPNWYTFFSYRGTPRPNLLTEMRYSERRLRIDGGGDLPGIVDSPMITITQAPGHYNAEYFDATDPDHRNNRQFTANVMRFLGGGGTGRHELKVGYEMFRSQRRAGNSQSASNYVFYADYAVDAAGSPLLDSEGRVQPLFRPGVTELEYWRPVRGATLNVDTQSIYAQDHWVVSPRLSADVGIRFEHVRSKATGGFIGIDTTSFVPRLAAAYDLKGDGKRLIHLTYGWYSGRANEAQVGENSNVGDPDLLVYSYVGPAGQGRSFAPGFDLANYEVFLGDFPSANVLIDDDLRTPTAKEFTASFGSDLLNGKGFAEVAYIHRNYSDLIEDFILPSTGSTTIAAEGTDFTFSNVLIANSDEAFREYRGLLFQARYNVSSRWLVNGHYTVQLRNDGNYEGEAPSQPGIPSLIGDYPEARSAARHWPSGHLDDFQRHKLRIWSIYSHPLRQYGVLSVSGLWRVDSGTTYSLRSTGVPLTLAQNARVLAAGYVDTPGSQAIFYGERGSESFKGYGLFDLSLNYDVTAFGNIRPWFKLDVYNLFNNQKLIRWNTAVTPDPRSERDELGLPTGYVEGPLFGKATSTGHFPNPFQGNNGGGRTLRLAIGLRF